MKYTAVILGLFLSMQSHADFQSDLQQCVPESHHGIMGLIVQHESRKSPYALGYTENGKLVSLYPQTQENARMKLKELLNRGVNVDIGYGQVNAQHFKTGRVFAQRGFSAEDALDPCTNLKMSAFLFSEAFQRTGSYVEALSIYNTGKPDAGLKNGYVQKIAQLIQ